MGRKGKAPSAKSAPKKEKKEDGPSMKEQVETFLTQCDAKLQSEETRNQLKDPESGRPNIAIRNVQTSMWKEMGVNPDIGYGAIDQLGSFFPDLLPKRSELGKTIIKVYMQCLEDRTPSELQKDGELTRDKVMEFLDTKDFYFELPETKERLSNHIKENGTMPDKVVDDIHDEIMEKIGVEKAFSRRCMEKFATEKTWAEDQELCTHYARTRSKTFEICIMLINEHRKAGGKVEVGPDVQARFQQIDAREWLDNSTQEQRDLLVDNNAKKVCVLRGLPGEARSQHLSKLTEEERFELIKCEILMINVEQRVAAERQAAIQAQQVD